MLSSTARSAILAFLAVGQASAMEEKITISDMTIHRIKSSAGDKIPKVSFRLSGARANGQLCEATDIAWPETEPSFPCGNTGYSFLLLPGEFGAPAEEAKEFGLMIYHDVRDRKADLRGWVNVDAVCKMVDDAAETCTLGGPIKETIDGPVASLWGWIFGDL